MIKITTIFNYFRFFNFRFLINENIFNKCFRSNLSLINLRISFLTIKYKCFRLFLLIITTILKINKIKSHVLFYYFMLMYSNICLL